MTPTASADDGPGLATECTSIPFCTSAVCLTCPRNFGITGIMTTVRGEHSATPLLDGRILMAGGDFGTTESSTAEIYDPSLGVFLPNISLNPPPPGGTMTAQRFFHAATLLLNGKVLITGGGTSTFVDEGPPTATAELYDPLSGRFTATDSMSVPRGDDTATLLTKSCDAGKVLVAGGHSGAHGAGKLSTAELFDPSTETFSVPFSMNFSHSFHSATELPDGTVLIAGGGGPFPGDFPKAELYDPCSRTFIETGSMTDGRNGHRATLLQSGKVLIVGGADSSDTVAFKTAELYDPSTKVFVATGPMITARDFPEATLLNDGRVLVSGGTQEPQGNSIGPCSPSSLSSAEVYEPLSGAFATAGTMTFARFGHSATLLATGPNSGSVLIAGGIDGCRANLLAELYRP